jgi:hypothetical protein
MRVPTSYREAGVYALTFDCEGEPAPDSKVQVYTTKHFKVIAEQQLMPGENELRFELPQEDQYFMILFTGGEAQSVRIAMPQIFKEK